MVLCAVLCAAACGEDVRVGVRCPSPYASGASILPAPDGGTKSVLYGTSCAPCDSADEPRRDANGCPTYVTFASCGGDICLFGELIERPSDNDGGVEDGDGG